jgi:hypothetical protein
MTATERLTERDRAEYAHALKRAKKARYHGDRAGATIAAGQAEAALRRILETQARAR